MPISPYVRNLVRETGKETEEIEECWYKAKRITEDTFGVPEDEFAEREFEYSRDVVYRMLGLDEAFSISEFIKSDMSAKDFIEQAVQTSGDFDINQGGQTHKRKPYQDEPEEEDEEKIRKFKQDGTGPHGQGAGPGEGKADGSGRKPGSKMSYEEELIFSGHAEINEEDNSDYEEMLDDEALPK